MITEIRPTHEPPRLILIPTCDEAKVIEQILGCVVKDGSGLICKLRGEYRMADGYGPAYLTVWLDQEDPSHDET